jgi:alpha-beta hydrolase superfamily lysophospholipase
VGSIAETSAPDQRFYIVGYSAGAALAADYTLSVLEGEALPRPDGLILISPAIGVSGVAAFAVWQARLGRWLGLNKPAWISILPEVDPHKYNSFAVNAGDQVYRLTKRIERCMTALSSEGRVRGMPPILAFQLVVDATVSTLALVDNLFLRLAPAGHELVLFDVNREAEVRSLLKFDPSVPVVELLEGIELPFDLTLATNENDDSLALTVRHRDALGDTLSESDIRLRWPSGIYSLSHVALPFPRDDPIYGVVTDDDRVSLGFMEIRGERGLLALPGDFTTRLRYNPFFEYLDDRIIAFVSER